jgi:glycerophosphoryl diester phosphodiesterase
MGTAELPSVFAASASGLLLFGHRGYSALAPENTLAAFAALLERRVPGVELDVQLSRDGKLLVAHDSNLKKVTGLDATVASRSAAEIRRLDAGSWFSPAFRGEKIPLLDEVFELLGDRLYYDVELKWPRREGGELEEKVLACMAAHGLEHRCLISSFNPFCIARVKKLAPRLPVAHIYARSPGLPLLLRHGEARWLWPTPFVKPQARQVQPASRLLYHRLLRSQILAWTVDEPAEAMRLVRLGVRGIISNHPGRILSVLPELAR